MIPPRHLLFVLLLTFSCACPTVASELDEIAQIHLNGDSPKALVRLEGYLKKHPKDVMAWTIKGNILEQIDDDDAAEAAYLSALAINPKAFEAICSMGILRRKRGDYDGAIRYYRRAIEINPDYAQAYSSMAVIEIRRGNDPEALRLAQIGYTKDQEDPVIAANLAIACHYSGKMDLRDKYTRIAEKLGYQRMETLAQIYSGELTIRDQ